MHFNKFSLTSAVAAILALSSCTDNNYDLNQLEGSKVRIAVNDLTIPVKADAITLDSILSLNDSSVIKRVNGEYAAVKEDIIKESDDIKIDEINISRPNDVVIEETIRNTDIHEIFDPTGGATVIDENEEILDINIPNASNVLTMNAQNIDNAVRAVSEVKLSKEEELNITLKFNNVNGVKSYSIRELAIQLPKGLTATANHNGTYNPATGIVTFDEEIKSSNLAVEVTITLTAISNSDDFVFNPGAQKGVKDSKGNLSLEKEIKVAGGKIHVIGSDLEARTIACVNTAFANDNIKYVATAKFKEDLTINTFSGDVYYVVDGINVSPVVLNDLPGILNQTGTEIGLDNPQLYISVNNPILQNQPASGVKPTAELGLTTKVDDISGGELTPDNGKITLGFAENTILLAPKPENHSYVSPTDPEKFNFSNVNTPVKFTKMSDILKGKTATEETRLPDSILVRIDPKVEQTVTNLKLTNYGKVSGKYAFYAPIKFTENSKIVYNDTIDGMNDKDADKIIIDKLNLSASLTTNMPVSALEITLTPFEYTNDWTENFDKATRPQNVRKDLAQKIDIPADGSGVIKNRPLNISFNPTASGKTPIKHIGGIIIDARIKASGKDALKPSQKINLNNIKVTVSGNYDTEL